MKLKVNYAMLLTLARTNKAFMFIDYKDDKILTYKLSNDILRYRNKFDTYRVVSTLQQEINNLTINIQTMYTYKTIDNAIAALEITYTQRRIYDNITLSQLNKATDQIISKGITKFNNTIYIVDEYDILA